LEWDSTASLQPNLANLFQHDRRPTAQSQSDFATNYEMLLGTLRLGAGGTVTVRRAASASGFLALLPAAGFSFTEAIAAAAAPATQAPPAEAIWTARTPRAGTLTDPAVVATITLEAGVAYRFVAQRNRVATGPSFHLVEFLSATSE
jgi:hypothetical protein